MFLLHFTSRIANENIFDSINGSRYNVECHHEISCDLLCNSFIMNEFIVIT